MYFYKSLSPQTLWCKAVFKLSPRELRRMMKRLGMQVEEISNVEEVVIKTSDKKYIIESPNVYLIKSKDFTMFQILGQYREEPIERITPETLGEALKISEEDVRLVASQTGVSLDEAREALIEAAGDIAKAILLIESRRKTSS